MTNSLGCRRASALKSEELLAADAAVQAVLAEAAAREAEEIAAEIQMGDLLHCDWMQFPKLQVCGLRSAGWGLRSAVCVQTLVQPWACF